MITMRKIALFTIVCLIALVLVGCDQTPTSDQVQNSKQEQINVEAVRQVGMPGITQFTEKRLVRELYELRDKADLATITYVRDMNGQPHKVCDSIGFGIPYATQFSSPEKVLHLGAGYHNTPQAEPNALFMPSSADATWVMCVVPGGNGKTTPTYIEDRITVSTFPLK